MHLGQNLCKPLKKAQDGCGVRQARLRHSIETYGTVAAVKDISDCTSDGVDTLVKPG